MKEREREIVQDEYTSCHLMCDRKLHTREVLLVCNFFSRSCLMFADVTVCVFVNITLCLSLPLLEHICNFLSLRTCKTHTETMISSTYRTKTRNRRKCPMTTTIDTCVGTNLIKVVNATILSLVYMLFVCSIGNRAHACSRWWWFVEAAATAVIMSVTWLVVGGWRTTTTATTKFETRQNR